MIIHGSTRGIKLTVQTHKKGIRTLGISESFQKHTSEKSVLAGVVIRADMIIDGFTFSKVTVGGMDATQKILDMYSSLNRDDINIIILNGCIISWFNVIDLNSIVDVIGIPLICLTYRDSVGLESNFKENFPEDSEHRIEIYQRNGPRIPMRLHTDHVVYVRYLRITKEDVIRVLNKITICGAVPEPLRIARILARSLRKSII